LNQQAQRCIHTVEARQQIARILAQCNEYPRQPEPTDSTSVRKLRDEIALGDSLITEVQGAERALAPAEIAAHTNAIQQRQIRLKAACKRQEDALAAVYGLRLKTHHELQEALAKVNRLRDVFVGTRDESEVSEIAAQLERILSDVGSWEIGDVSVDRLDVLLTHQCELQLVAMKVFLEARRWSPHGIWQRSTNPSRMNVWRQLGDVPRNGSARDWRWQHRSRPSIGSAAWLLSGS
jgi:hypothetical protein